ncbi:gag-pol polyprotein [Lasius niger]|uniref:RNA-directed DNA polymerase n=1 Tax=Lasius niger TaxID=67767 RepID=A0A0J7KUZ1_LASNI|nr:gag-pol polyprotein [Lasius niger]
MGAVIQQQIGQEWQPLAFLSKKLNNAQRKYSPYDRELLAIYTAIKHYRHLLEGRKFTVYTNHKPLTFAFDQDTSRSSPRQARYLEYIGQFTTDIQYIKGKNNIIADTLSQVESIHRAIHPETLAQEQEKDNKIKEILAANKGLKLTQIPVPESATAVYCDTTSPITRPYVPKSLRRQVFQSLHDLAHPGKRATAKLIMQRYVWPHIQQDCMKWARAYIHCQKSKITRHNNTTVGSFIQPTKRSLYTHRHSGTTTNISRLQILPHYCGSFHKMARSHPST